jgi:hypothetical protein
MSTRFALHHGDIMVGDPIGELLGGELADIVYSDPPWGQGNLTYWRTHNGEPSTTDWRGFLERFCSTVVRHARPGAPLFVEMGLRWVDELAAVMASHGRTETARWTCVYGRPARPNILWYSGPPVDLDVSGLGGPPMTTKALSSVARPDAIVLDPCCGKGMTARVALQLGMRFRGNELNHKRLTVTEQWCAKWQRRNGAT